MDSRTPTQLQPNQLHSTIEAATLLGVAEATLRSRKSRCKGILVEGTHWQQQNGGTFWTIAGLLTIAERTSTPEAKALLSQVAKVPHSQATPLTLVVDNTAAKDNNIEAIASIKPSNGLSAEEAQTFAETMEGKLPNPEVQSLLQQMQDLSATSEQAQDQAETPLPPSQPRDAKHRLIIAALGVAVLILGGAGGWLIRSTVAPSATHSDRDDRNVALRLKPDVAARDSAIDHALTLATQHQDAIDLLRRDYLLIQAERERKSTGTAIDQWLIRHLNRQAETLQQSAARNSGSAEQIAIARSITGETKATLLALRSGRIPTASYSSTTAALDRSLRQMTSSKEAKSNGLQR